MNKLKNKLRTTYNDLSIALIEVYFTEKYYRFYKGHQAKVSLATACFHIGQGFGYIQGASIGLSSRIDHLRTAILNRLK
tara:strand:- start:178 stop:414 length:237 start_codon:yes stop_codon:yes gene_type:complete